jgi:signal transduction histidine kinase
VSSAGESSLSATAPSGSAGPGAAIDHPPLPWLDGGCALLDADRRISAIEPRFAQWLKEQPEILAGKEFPGVLARCCAAAGDSVAQLLKQAAPFAETSLPCDETRAHWLRAAVSRHPGGWTVHCRSVLPPSAELAEAGWRDELASQAPREELFLRLQKAEAQLENLAFRWPGVIFTQRPDFTFQFVGPHIADLTGIPAPEWQRPARSFWPLVHEADAEEMQKHVRRCAQVSGTLTTTFRLRHAVTGKIAHILEHRQAVRTRSGLLLSYEGVWLDITRQTIAERRLSAAAWKETLAMLTMGLAHDFNNILAGITALSETFLAQMEPDHAFAEGLTLIRNNSRHASQLVHRIMSLHRARTGEHNYHNLNEIVTEFAELVEKILPRRIRVVKELSAEALPVYADAVELRQMVLNFALNSADAMPDRGQFTVRTSRHTEWKAPENFVGIAPRLPCICLEVEDTGCGIPPRHIPVLFDPFFTTKPVNKGSGLGLYNARHCAEKHHGGISVTSAEGRGTTFRVWMPEADFTEAERAQAGPAPRRSLLLQGEHGLLLDSTAEFLRTNGYYVVKASVEDGRDLLSAEENSFAAVLYVTHPQNAGLPEVIRAVRQKHPEVKIVLQITGETADELDSELMHCGHLTITNAMSEAGILESLNALLRDGT